MANLQARINRIYSALSGIREDDLTKFPPKVVDDDGVVRIWLDFRGGMSDADLENAAHALVYNIAHIRDHLRNWAARDRSKLQKIDATLKSSQPFLIIKDLCNSDKHGYDPLHNGWSGLGPKLQDLRRPMRVTTGAKTASAAGITLDLKTGQVEPFASDGGAVDVIFTGAVIDKSGALIGDFHDLATQAVDMIESLVEELGIRPV